MVHPLGAILLIILCGSLVGAEDFAEMERWAARKLDFLRRLHAEGINPAEIARRVGIGRASVYRILADELAEA